jgi:hypothetical protein
MTHVSALLSCSASGQVVLHGISDGTNPAKKLKTLLQKGTRTGCLGFAQGQPSLLCCAKDSGQLLVWDINHVAQGPTEIGVHRVSVCACVMNPVRCRMHIQAQVA